MLHLASPPNAWNYHDNMAGLRHTLAVNPKQSLQQHESDQSRAGGLGSTDKSHSR